MCGILGLVSPRHAQPTDAMWKALDVLGLRGPDGRALVTGGLEGLTRVEPGRTSEAGPIVLGHTRLAIIDLDDKANQPMGSADGRRWVVFNGEIYNHVALRRELIGLGFHFQTHHSDTEVLLQGYSAWGPALFARLNGMFAIALVDLDRRELVLARDRLGQKPLFFVHAQDGVAFASDPLALTAAGRVTTQIDHEALHAYLQWGYVPDTQCIFEGLHKLPPGTWRCFALPDVESSDQGTIWSVPPARPNHTDHASWSARFDELLDDAVRIRLASDVPLGIFLSGGLDSARMVQAARDVPDMHTFTATFGTKRYDESDGARWVADHFGTKHIELRINPRGAMGELDQFNAAFPEPLSDSSTLALYLLAKRAREHITVAVGGDGGDELLGGYTRYSLLARIHPWLAGKRGLLTRPVAAALRTAWPERVRGRGIIDALHPDPRQAYGQIMGDPWFCRQSTLNLEAQPCAWPDPEAELIRAAMASDRESYLPGDLLVKADRATMASSLEIRAPLLDHRLWDHVAGAPTAWLRSPTGQAKLPLRHAVATHLGQAYVDRPKRGFTVPLGEWFRGPLDGWVHERIDRSDSLTTTLFGPGFGTSLLDLHRRSTRDFSARLWRVLQLELWAQRTGASL